MEKVFDWHIDRECGDCGTMWRIRKDDLQFKEEERKMVHMMRDAGFNTSNFPEYKFFVVCENCDNTIQVKAEEIPRLIADALRELGGDPHMHELQYALERV